MSYATLMVHLQLGVSNDSILKVAASLTERLETHVIGVALCQPLRVIYTDGYVPPEIVTQDRQQIDQEMRQAEDGFRAALAGRAASLGWRSIVTFESLSDHLAREARNTDLVITSIDHAATVLDHSRHVDTDDAVMRAGRPCLIVPSDTADFKLEHALIGWKDSTETRRAISNAVPMLQLAKRVTVLEIAAEDDHSAAWNRLGDVTAWLKRHGIDARSEVRAEGSSDAAALRDAIQEHNADLLVAGAYGHSRVREWALGGVTRDLLLNGSVCALLSH